MLERIYAIVFVDIIQHTLSTILIRKIINSSLTANIIQ